MGILPLQRARGALLPHILLSKVISLPTCLYVNGYLFLPRLVQLCESPDEMLIGWFTGLPLKRIMDFV